MASSKKPSNGRSPLVNQQRQITAFFGKKLDCSPSSSPSPSPALSKQNSNPKKSPSPSPSPITPSPLESKRKKPVLFIGHNLAPSPPENRSSEKSYGPEVINRRIKVYWPLDKSWYEGWVKSFDKMSAKHLVQYDDGEEEMLNISEEKIEWIEEPSKKKLRRLRRISVVDDEEEEDDFKELEDDSDDEDWGKKAQDEIVEDEDGLEDMDLEVENEESGSGGTRKKLSSRKRKMSEGEQMVSLASKKSKTGAVLKSNVPFAGDAEKLMDSTKRTSANSK